MVSPAGTSFRLILALFDQDDFTIKRRRSVQSPTKCAHRFKHGRKSGLPSGES
jgi:hypothetical protein